MSDESRYLIEDWHNFLNERVDDMDRRLSKNWEDWTIHEFEGLIKMGGELERKTLRSTLTSLVGHEALRTGLFGPKAAIGMTLWRFLKDLKSRINKEGASDDNPEDYPILDLLDMDPFLIRTVDQDILNAIDKEYDEYLKSLNYESTLGEIEDINHFIRRNIAEDTFGRVTIVDKGIHENWQRFLNEDIDVDLGEDEMYLYHISSAANIEVFDPAIAARRPQSYTKQEYRSWSRPRVFFFTKWGQEDSAIGKIGGASLYRVKLKKSELYPIYKDPLKLSYPEMKDKYKEIDPHGFGMFNTFERVATLAEKLHGYIGFIYPQNNDPDKTIVALWKKVPAEKIDEPFYK